MRAVHSCNSWFYASLVRIQYWLGSWDTVIFVFMLSLVMAPSGHLDRYIFIKFWNNSMQESFWHKFGQNPLIGWINCNQWFLRYCHIRIYAIFSNSPWWPSWIVNLNKFEIIPFKKSKQLHTRNILAQCWITLNQWFLRYCHFRVYAIFSNGPWGPSWIVNLYKYEMVPFRDHCDRIWPKYIHIFLRY